MTTMKNLILGVIFLFALGACQKSYIQVYDIKSTNTDLVNELFVFESDTIRITYYFWQKQGIMSFAVYNKLDSPIYLDWKKSSYIDNSSKLDYWVDGEVSSSLSYYGSYFYSGPLVKAGYQVSEGAAVSTATTVKLERITFIPPNSNSFRSQFYLFPVEYLELNEDSKSIEVLKRRSKKKMTKIYTQNFSKSDSPLVFRNYLAFSTSEDFKDEIFIDNEFYLSSIKEMDYEYFRYLEKDSKGNWVEIKPFKRPTSFYLYVPNINSIEYRKKSFTR